MIIDINGGGGGGGGDIDVRKVKEIVDASLVVYTDNIENGDPIVGMAAQLQSIDGFDTHGAFRKRTSGGDDSLSSGNAKLLAIGAATTFSVPVFANATAIITQGPRLSVEFVGDLATWYADRSSYTFTYLNGTWENEYGDDASTAMESFTVSGTVLDGDSFQFDIEENEGTYTSNITYSLIVRTLSVSVDANAFEDEAYETGVSVYSYEYENGAWNNLPNAVTVVGDLIDGDTVIVTFTPHDYGQINQNQPTVFKSTSMNQFNGETYENGKTINDNMEVVTASTATSIVYVTDMIPNLTDGYVVYSKNSGLTKVVLNSSTEPVSGVVITNGTNITITNNEFAVVFPHSRYDSVYVVTDDVESICIHPRWSGTKDLVYGAYWVSEVNIPDVENFYSIADTKNEIDFNTGMYIERVSAMTATEQLIQEYISNSALTYGVDYIFDDNTIVYTLSAAVTTDISHLIQNYEYQVDDFGTEEFDGYADGRMEYSTNLVDKLRVDVLTRSNIVRCTQAEYNSIEQKDRNTQYIITDATAVDMESYNNIVDCTTNGLPQVGAVGKLYLYNGHYLKWVEESGNWGEWGSNSLKYGVIPSSMDGEMICRFGPQITSSIYQTYLFYDEANNTLNAYDNEEATGSTIGSITLGSKNVLIGNGGAYNYSISWVDGYLFFGRGYYDCSMYYLCPTAITGGHYVPANDEYVASRAFISKNSGVPIWNEEGIIVGQQRSANLVAFKLNPTGQYDMPTSVLAEHGNAIGPFFAPTNGGNGSGYVLQSGGEWATPTWVSLASMMGGLTIWCGSEDDYEAIVAKDSNTLYIIREDEE